MKKQILRITLGLLVASAPSAFADKVKFTELPASVQTAVKSQVGSAQIEDIDKEIRNGQVVYEVAFKRNGQHTELLVATDGTILSGGASRADASTASVNTPLLSTSNVNTPLGGARKVSMNDVPLVVQNAIRAQAQGSRIEDIEVGTLNGKTAYQAAFKRDGKHVELRLAEDGSILTGIKSNRLTAELNALPEAVQKTVHAQVGSGEIIDIQRGHRKGKTVYGVEFLRDNKDQVLHIAEDGAIVRHKVLREIKGTAGIEQRISSSPDSRKVTMNELPLAVQNTIRSQAGRERIEDIDRQVREGKVVYEVAYRRNGQLTEFLVNEDGSLAQASPIISRGVGGVSSARSSLFGPSLNELPRAVQNTVRAAQLGGAEVADIDRNTRDGRTVYEVELEHHGKLRGLVIAEDGSIIQERQ